MAEKHSWPVSRGRAFWWTESLWAATARSAGALASCTSQGQVIEPLDLHYWGPDDYPTPGPIGASEMAGPRWSPDGSRLFINVQYPGVTCVIEGPGHTLG